MIIQGSWSLQRLKLCPKVKSCQIFHYSHKFYSLEIYNFSLHCIYVCTGHFQITWFYNRTKTNVCHRRLQESMVKCSHWSLSLCWFSLQEAIKEKYNVPSDQLRIYVHYQPSYYHFHVHFTHLKYDAPGCGIGRAHLLPEVIDNIENIDSEYYVKKTFSCLFKETDKLYKRFQSVKQDKAGQGEDHWWFLA